MNDSESVGTNYTILLSTVFVSTAEGDVPQEQANL